MSKKIKDNAMRDTIERSLAKAREDMEKERVSVGVLGYIVGGFQILLAGVFISLIVMLTYRTVADKPIGTLSSGIIKTESAKLSYKGYLWHTYDGWTTSGIAGGFRTNRWYFTIADNNEKVVKCITEGDYIKLYYHDYIWMPFKKGYSHQVYKCEEIGVRNEHK